MSTLGASFCKLNITYYIIENEINFKLSAKLIYENCRVVLHVKSLPDLLLHCFVFLSAAHSVEQIDLFFFV